MLNPVMVGGWPVHHVPLPDAPPPHVAHRLLAARHETTFILESREGPDRMARYSFVGFDPAGTIACTRDGIVVTGALPAPSQDQEPLEFLRRVLAFYATKDHDSPFVGGLVGSVGHDFVRIVEPTLDDGSAESWPRFIFGLYLDGLVWDHRKHTCTYVSRGADRSALVRQAFQTPPAGQPLEIGAFEAPVAQPEFEARVRAAQELIRAGECFQIVLSRLYIAPFHGPLVTFYDWLREAHAVPYLYHLRFAGRDVIGASPEMLVRVRKGVLETFPIAGTRPLAGDDAVDAARGRDLLLDRKETAEHAMLVDLARNDLGRVAAPGSVQVVELMKLKRFRNVQHIVSDVRAELAPGHDALDALEAVFPAGTVSGAPKVRALEHIAKLEARPRGAYAGAVCYASFNGDFDSAICIRSLSAADGRITVQAGAGIVQHSDPAAEFHETRHKAGAMLEGSRVFGATLPPEPDGAPSSSDRATPSGEPDALDRAIGESGAGR